ncbi:hypothetical protein B0H21DRAFT_706523 [Amylocystis lapponica]|nr:hypothetical protein B0H21DRAFT_706523 [Amylocystis lapponica]
MYGEAAAPPVDPYSDAYNEPPLPAPGPAGDPRDRDMPPPRGRSRSRSPPRGGGPASSFRRSPVPRRPPHAPIAPNPSNVLGVFGLSIRTTERDLDEEFSRFGRVEKVVIVYDQRSDRSRGFGFITMSTVDEASRCIKELNGVDLNGRRIRVDYSVTDRPHAPTPGEYMGHRRRRGRDTYSGAGGRDVREDRYDDYRGAAIGVIVTRTLAATRGTVTLMAGTTGTGANAGARLLVVGTPRNTEGAGAIPEAPREAAALPASVTSMHPPRPTGRPMAKAEASKVAKTTAAVSVRKIQCNLLNFLVWTAFPRSQ